MVRCMFIIINKNDLYHLRIRRFSNKTGLVIYYQVIV